jgi:hypothetical protein
LETKVSVRSDLLKIAEDLKVIAKTAEDTANSLSEATKEVASNVNDQVAVTTGGLDKIRKFGKAIAKDLASDFKALFSVNALASGMKLSEQFAGSIKQAVSLNDAMRNLAPIFGMNEEKAEKFKRTLVKGLAEIGLGSDAAANALQGLAETNVRGEENLSAYAKTAGELAGITNQKGQEGEIGKGLARVVTAQGGNVNDPRAMQRVADDVVRIRNATGKSATEALKTLDDLFSHANSELKGKITGGGGVSLASAALIGGAGSTDFLKRFLGMDWRQRSGLEARGMGKLIGSNGELNPDAFQKTLATAKNLGGGNVEAGLTTFGMSDEEAKGFMRLAEAMKVNGDAIERARQSTVSINDEYRKTMGLGDAFRANLNKVKGGFTELMDKMGAPDVINKTTDVLGKASQSGAGAAAVVGGSALLAAVLTGKGLKGIGGSLLGDEAKAKAIEAVTGEHVQKVEVINFPAGMGLGGLGGAATGAGGMLGKAGLYGGALAVGAGAATAVDSIPAVHTAAQSIAGKVLDLFGADSQAKAERMAKEQEEFRARRITGGAMSADQVAAITRSMRQDVKVTIDTKDKSLKAYSSGSRGNAQ